MQKDTLRYNEHHHSSSYRRRPRGPRFALIMLIIMAILSVILALTVAFILI